MVNDLRNLLCIHSTIQVAAVREGMAWIVPVPLLSLCTAKMLETTVCGHEEVDLQMLKKVVRYSDLDTILMCVIF